MSFASLLYYKIDNYVVPLLHDDPFENRWMVAR